ncbi:MAG: hypothetical protein ACREK5_07465 [Gemmatimonadota bacterium]
MTRSIVRLSAEGTALVGLLSLVAGFSPARDGVRDEKAIQIVRRCLDAIETGWALQAYDRASQVRAAVNVRGTQPAVGVTANVVADRAGRRMRIDAAGDVGPLTLLADRERILLYVPATAQFARRAAGALAPGEWMAASLTAEVAAIRTRLDAGYPLLVYRGREEIGGRPMDVVEDTPEPNATATYWIDATSSLPWRVVLSRPGRGDVRLDLTYGNGPRPTAAELQVQGDRSTRISLTPRYDGSGRVSRLQAVARTTTGGTLTTDITFDWAPDTGRGFFGFQPPAGTAEVPFQQLVSGVLLASAGKLGALLQLFAGLA